MKHLGQLANSDAILRCHGILSQHDLAKLHVQTGRGPSGPRPGAGVLAGGLAMPSWIGTIRTPGHS